MCCQQDPGQTGRTVVVCGVYVRFCGVQTQTRGSVNKLYFDLVAVLNGKLDNRLDIFIKIDFDSWPVKELIDQLLG